MLKKSDIAEPALQRLYDVWVMSRKNGGIPSRQEMDLPFSIPFALPKISLIDVIWQDDGKPRYRYRLIGSDIVELIGQNCTGRYLDDVFRNDNFATKLFGWLNEVAFGGAPHYTTIEYPWQSIRLFSRLSLPLSNEGNTNQVCCILAGIEAKHGEGDFASYRQTHSLP